MKPAELMRFQTGTAGMDVVVTVEEPFESGRVRLVLDSHGNGTRETAELRFTDMLKLKSTLGTLIRKRKGREKAVKEWRQPSSDEVRSLRQAVEYDAAIERNDEQWRAKVAELGRELLLLRSGKPGHDVYVAWRGSVGDLVTDLKPLLTGEQLQELAGELAVAWRERRSKESGGQGGAGPT